MTNNENLYETLLKESFTKDEIEYFKAIKNIPLNDDLSLDPGPSRALQATKEDKAYLDYSRTRTTKINNLVNYYTDMKFKECFICASNSIKRELVDSHTVPKSKMLLISEKDKVIDLSLHKTLFTRDENVGNLFTSNISTKSAGTFNKICSNHDKSLFRFYEDRSLELINEEQLKAIALKTSLAANYFYTKEAYRIHATFGTPEPTDYNTISYNLLKSYSDCANLGESASKSLLNNEKLKLNLICNFVIPTKPVFAMQSYFSVPSEFNENFRVYVNVFPEIMGNRILIFTDSEDTDNFNKLKECFTVGKIVIFGLINMRFTSFLSPSLSKSAQKSKLFNLLGKQAVSEVNNDEDLDIMKLFNLSLLAQNDSWLL